MDFVRGEDYKKMTSVRTLNDYIARPYGLRDAVNNPAKVLNQNPGLKDYVEKTSSEQYPTGNVIPLISLSAEVRETNQLFATLVTKTDPISGQQLPYDEVQQIKQAFLQKVGSAQKLLSGYLGSLEDIQERLVSSWIDSLNFLSSIVDSECAERQIVLCVEELLSNPYQPITQTQEFLGAEHQLDNIHKRMGGQSLYAEQYQSEERPEALFNCAIGYLLKVVRVMNTVKQKSEFDEKKHPDWSQAVDRMRDLISSYAVYTDYQPQTIFADSIDSDFSIGEDLYKRDFSANHDYSEELGTERLPNLNFDGQFDLLLQEWRDFDRDSELDLLDQEIEESDRLAAELGWEFDDLPFSVPSGEEIDSLSNDGIASLLQAIENTDGDPEDDLHGDYEEY